MTNRTDETNSQSQSGSTCPPDRDEPRTDAAAAIDAVADLFKPRR